MSVQGGKRTHPTRILPRVLAAAIECYQRQWLRLSCRGVSQRCRPVCNDFADAGLQQWQGV